MRTPTAMPELTAVSFRVKAFGEELLAASAIADDLGTFAAGQGTASGLRGTADAAYQRNRRSIGAAGDAYSLAMRGVADQVLDHAAELDRLSTQHADLISRYDDLIRLAQTPADPDVALQGPAHLDPLLLDAAVVDYEADRAAWIRRLADAETAVLVALRRVMTLEQVERRYGHATDPADGVLDTVPAAGASPAAVRAWWLTLTRAQRLGLIAADPEVIGNRDGIPAWARDRANVVMLQRDQQELGEVPPGQLTRAQATRLANANAADRARMRMARAIDPLTGGHYPTQLYSYAPDAFDGDGAVAIGLGDLDTADNVAITVPGFGSDMGSAPAQSTKAIDLQQAADFLGNGHTNATMFWIGYDAPDNLPWAEGGIDAAGVVTEVMARAGGHRLAATINGLERMRPRDPHLTVIGHSYGSTTAGLGASYSVPGQVDDLVLVGSPGAGQEIHHASDTGVADGHVWDGRNSDDAVARLGNHGRFNLQSIGGGLGTDPASAGFGAHRFEAESVTRGDGIDDHLKYFDHDTESLANMARIVNGEYAAVAQAPPVHDPLLLDPQRHLSAIAGNTRGLLGDVTDAVLHPTHAPHDAVDGFLRGDSVFDALVGGPEDPEADRTPTAPDTGR